MKLLTAEDDLGHFDSGESVLDDWLKRHALKNQEKGHGTTHVAVDDNNVVVGFVSTHAASVERARVKRGQGPDRWSALLIGRMAVHKDHHRQGIGRQLMAHAFLIADAQYKLSGCAALIVDAKPNAVSYYVQYGFKKLLVLPDDAPQTDQSATKMYLAIQTVRQAIEASGWSRKDEVTNVKQSERAATDGLPTVNAAADS